ncbi:MAG: DNA primase [Proteobacteria bacterium]|nr:DNA primase [Pseudomonadota bacterium]
MLQKTGFISRDQKERILKATDIVQLVSGYVQLKASGQKYLGLCPFHQEKTPSFSVSPAYQNYKCFGCDESGDAIRFVMEIENLQFVEAIRFLADRCGIRIEIEGFDSARSSAQTEIGKCIQESFDFFRSNLANASNSSPIRDYLRRRSISDDLIERFQMGYVGPGWTNLHDLLKKKSIGTEVQESAGLIKKGEKGGYYDRLRDRLIFPIRDSQKRILGFAGRALGDAKPKYLNPPETELYKKSSVLYGLFEALPQIRKKRRVIMVEGYLDVVRLHEHSWTESVATCGTAVSEGHIKALKRFGADEVILLFDGDAAGIKAAERSAKLFVENDIDSRVVILPEDLDPDDYFKKYDSKDFQVLLDNARHDYEFIIDQVRQTAAGKGIEHQKAGIEEILLLAKSIKTTIKKELFLSKVAASFDVEKKTLQKSILQRKGRDFYRSDSPPQGNARIYFNKNERPQVRFIQYLITHVRAIELARELVTPQDLNHRDLSNLYARFLRLSMEEFQSLKSQEFPEIFVEYSSLLLYLLHNESEYRGPLSSRSKTSEMAQLHDENKMLTDNYSEKALKRLVARLKKHNKSHEIKDLYSVEPDQARALLTRIIEKRRQTSQ